VRTRAAIFAVCWSLAGYLNAQNALEHPQLGVMLDRAGWARPIYGVAGSVTSGDPVATAATAVACSKRICLVQTESGILSAANGLLPTPAGPAVLALDGDSAFGYFPQSPRLIRWRIGQIEPVDLPVPEAASNGGMIVALLVRKGDLEFAVTRESGTWIVRSDGTIVEFVTEGTGPVLLLQPGVLFATADGLVLRRSDGNEVRFDVAGVDGLFEFGEGYVEARTAQAVYAIRMEPGHERIFLLPESQP
jgi:hypothetical protein